MNARVLFSWVGVVVAISACDISAECLPWFKGAACITSDLGMACSSDEALVRRNVTIRKTSNTLVADPRFENCDQRLCASTTGSVPYCTRRCETALDCDPQPWCPLGYNKCPRTHWKCDVMVEFGALACQQPDENGDCELDPDTGKVRYPARYCVNTGAKDGTPSDLSGGVDGGI